MTADQNDRSRSPSATIPRIDPGPAATGGSPLPSGGSLTCLLVHGEDLGRTGLRLIIESRPGLVVTAEAGDGVQALPVAGSQRPDVVVVDLFPPGADELDSTGHPGSDAGDAGERRPAVIILAGVQDQATPPQCLVAGAVGVLVRTGQPDALVAAARTAHAGRVVLDPGPSRPALVGPRPAPEVAPSVTELNGRALGCALSSLSPREREVLVALATGRSNRQLAADLRVKESTVKTHVSRLLNKLALRSRTEAAALAYQLGVVQRPDRPVSPIPDF
jgi:DNA-binding NarL/FixJ family response regulator